MTRSLDQIRAAFALGKAQAAALQQLRDESGKPAPSPATQYRAYVRSLPATILANGLGQALAMELAGAAKREGHGLLIDHVCAWLTDEQGWQHSPYRGTVPDNNYRSIRLINAIIHGTGDHLVLAQFETMAYLKWLKKFAEALIESSAETGEDA
jgi:CRISPR-associated protein Cmr5